MNKHITTLSMDSINAFFKPLRDKTVTIVPWAFNPVYKADRYDSQGEGSDHGEALAPITLRAGDDAQLLYERLIPAANACKADQELGLISKVVLHDCVGPSFAYVEMLDMAPSIKEPSIKYNETLLDSGSSYHIYGPLLLGKLSFEERLRSGYPIDTAWVGFALTKGFAVLRITGVTKPSPKLVVGKLGKEEDSHDPY